MASCLQVQRGPSVGDYGIKPARMYECSSVFPLGYRKRGRQHCGTWQIIFTGSSAVSNAPALVCSEYNVTKLRLRVHQNALRRSAAQARTGLRATTMRRNKRGRWTTACTGHGKLPRGANAGISKQSGVAFLVSGGHTMLHSSPPTGPDPTRDNPAMRPAIANDASLISRPPSLETHKRVIKC
ncbi:hypothetical protein BV25DRAFT_1447402 [Artomyces pyxidatus]|uniref:Uncharacterized protein n=1 Tax=Artomyces pyxidatus TaxID=48021 RepID=A0ACB8SLW2_9AGAM|nr:hypothetical protein BV25DRAFT_1447402 [Artomyces pyxidatus]